MTVTAPWEVERTESARHQQGEGGITGGEEDGGELVGTPSSEGLGPSRRSCTTTDSVK